MESTVETTQVDVHEHISAEDLSALTALDYGMNEPGEGELRALCAGLDLIFGLDPEGV